jgi:Papain fold toxin 2
MSGFTDEEIYRAIGIIISQFKLLECAPCAEAIKQWCQANEISGYKLRLTTQNDFEDYIISDRLEQQGISESITVNGVHYGIEVRGKVFDNLSSQGLSREEWQADFHCPSEAFLLAVVESF